MNEFGKPGFVLIAGLGLFGLSACGLNSQVKVTTSGGNCAAGSIESSCAAQSSALLSLTGRRPLAIKSGDTVTFTGTGFNKAMSATIGGIPVTSLDVTSATSASLVVPPGVATGMSDLKLALTAAEATASVAYSPAGGIPLMTVAASEVCAGVEFYDLNGDKQTGTKSCSGSSSTPECTANGSVGCVTTTSYKSADFTNLLAGNIKSGVTVAGVAGNVTLPVASDVKTGSASYGTSGTQFTPSYSPDFPDVTNVKTTDTVNGAAGTLDLSNLLAGNIKSGVTVAGVGGQYPSATYTLTGDTGTADLDSSTFEDKIKSATAFEWFGPDGVLYSGAGNADLNTAANIASGVTIFGMTGNLVASETPDAWDLRAGTTVGLVTGKLKVNCRNAVRLSGTTGFFDNTTSPAAAGSDIWDTIDDYYGLPAFTDFPSFWSVANNYCGGVDDPNSSSDDDNAWRDVTTTNGTMASTCEATAANCTMKDKISGLKWSKLASLGPVWQDAITTCNGLTHNGQTAGSWRLPTQKELLEAYNHGITSAARTDAHWMTLVDMQQNYWSSSSHTEYKIYAWFVNLANGYANIHAKHYINLAVVCVQ